MTGILAKWIFAAAAILPPGVDQDLPVLQQLTPQSSEVYQLVAMSGYQPVTCPPVPAGVVAPACTPTTAPVLQFQTFCTTPGVWTISLRLGLLASQAAGGKIWVDSSSGRALLTAFAAAPGAPAWISATLPVFSQEAASCYRIQFETNAPLEVVADPRLSFLTLSR